MVASGAAGTDGLRSVRTPCVPPSVTNPDPTRRDRRTRSPSPPSLGMRCMMHYDVTRLYRLRGVQIVKRIESRSSNKSRYPPCPPDATLTCTRHGLRFHLRSRLVPRSLALYARALRNMRTTVFECGKTTRVAAVNASDPGGTPPTR
jgi:hypothetical protein